MRFAIAAAGLTLLSACASQGPVFRGDPPPGYTAEEYERKLTGKRKMDPFDYDRSPAIGDSPSPAEAPGP